MGASSGSTAVSDQNRLSGSEIKRQACLGEWRAEADQTTVPSGLLRRGKVYFWQVEALVDGKPHLSPTVGFWVISDGALRKVEATERDYKDSELVLTAMYEAHGLYEEALTQVEKLSNKNKNMADLAQDMRRRLHLQLEKD